MTTEVKKLNLVQRAVLKLKGGDEAAVRETGDFLIRAWESKIVTCKRNIEEIQYQKKRKVEELKMKLKDAKEQFEITFENIKPIRGYDERVAYVEEFQKAAEKSNAIVQDLEDQIKFEEEKCEYFEKEQKAIIKQYEKMLAKFSEEKEVTIEN